MCFAVKPDKVFISKKLPKNPKVGGVVETICRTPASNPTVTIEWKKDRKLILQSEQINISRFEGRGEFNANYTYSILSFTMSTDLMGSSFSCFVDQQPYLKSKETTVERKLLFDIFVVVCMI